MTVNRTSHALAIARAALPAYGLPETAPLTLLKQRENSVFRTTHEGAEYVLRVHRQGYHSDAALASELSFIAALADAAIAVPRFTPTLAGDPFHVVADPIDASPHQVDLQLHIANDGMFGSERSGVDGSAELDPAEFAALGALIASVHDATERSGYELRSPRAHWDLAGLTGPDFTWGDPLRLPELTASERSTLSAALDQVRSTLLAYGTSADRFGPIHADLTPENVLRTPTGLALIDFDDFATGWHLFDLATALYFYTPHPRAAEYRAALFRGYESVRPLTDDDHRAFPALLVARGLSYLGWAADRRGEDTAEWHAATLLPHVVELARELLDPAAALPSVPIRSATTEALATQATAQLIARRNRTIGPHSPLFYREPLHLVSGSGVWLTTASGERYLDGYNNVPHVGHANERVTEAIRAQSARLNIHTRYLNDRVVDYAEQLLATFTPNLDRVLFGNSGSEANELAIRIARQLTGATGMIVSDFSYHGTTITLAELTTGLRTREPLAAHVRAVRIPDLDSDPRSEAELLAEFATQLDAAIASLREEGYGLAASLFDPLFSTEGMPRVPAGLHQLIAERVRAAGGLVIADEVQSGFGRTGSHMWGHRYAGLDPDLVTLGKPMGNGHPISAVVTSAAVLDAFGSRNEFFNTFAGNPVSAAAGEAVLAEMAEHGLRERAERLGTAALSHMQGLANRHDFVRSAKGVGMFLGLDFAVAGRPAPELAALAVEGMKERGVLISRIGPHESVLKIRPPLAFSEAELPILLDALDSTLASLARYREPDFRCTLSP